MQATIVGSNGKQVLLTMNDIHLNLEKKYLQGLGYDCSVNEKVDFAMLDNGVCDIKRKVKMRKTRVYIAGPMTLGDYAENLRAGMWAFYQLCKLGFVPFCPHWSAQQQMYIHLTHEHWLEYDKEWLALCDVLCRLPGESKGADEEEAFARKLGIKVVHTMAELERVPREVPCS